MTEPRELRDILAEAMRRIEMSAQDWAPLSPITRERWHDEATLLIGSANTLGFDLALIPRNRPDASPCCGITCHAIIAAKETA